MAKKLVLVSCLVLFALLAVIVSGCNGALPTFSSVQEQQSGKGLTGRLIVKITDAPLDNVDKVNLTISSLEVHLGANIQPTMTGAQIQNTEVNTEQAQEQEREKNNSAGKSQNQNKNQQRNQNQVTSMVQATTQSTPVDNANAGWIALELKPDLDQDNNPDNGITFNLLDFQNGLQGLLADTSLPTGKYTQIRLYISDVQLVFNDGKTANVKLPGDKLKFIHPFEITGDEDTILTFDFVVSESIHMTGNGQYILKPVIKLNTERVPRNQTPTPAVNPLEITTSSLPDGVVGQAYSATLAATGGREPYTWSFYGNWPDGLGLESTTGEISGTPSIAGTYTFTVEVKDRSATRIATRDFTINITTAP